MNNKPPFTPDKPAKTPGVVVGKKRPEQMSRARHLARLALQKQWKKIGEEVELDEVAKWRENPAAHDYDTDGTILPKTHGQHDPLQARSNYLSAAKAYIKKNIKNPKNARKQSQAYAKSAMKMYKEGVEQVDEMDKSQPSSSRGAEGLATGSPATQTSYKKVKSNALVTLDQAYAKMRKQKQKQHPKTKGFLQRLLNREEVQAESYEKAQQHKALAAKALETNDTSGYNKHMSDHHEEMGKWHESKGRSDLAQREFDKAEQSHEKFLSTTLKGNSKMKKGEYDSPARKAMEKELQYNPKYRMEEVEQIDEASGYKLDWQSTVMHVPNENINQPVKTTRKFYEIHKDGEKVGELEHHYNEHDGHSYRGNLHGRKFPWDKNKNSVDKDNAQSYLANALKSKWHTSKHGATNEEVEQIDEKLSPFSTVGKMLTRSKLRGKENRFAYIAHSERPLTPDEQKERSKVRRVGARLGTDVTEEVEQIDEDSGKISDFKDRQSYLGHKKMERDHAQQLKNTKSPMKQVHHSNMIRQHSDAANKILDKYRTEEVEQVNEASSETTHVAYLRPKKDAPPEARDHFELPVHSDNKESAHKKFTRVFGDMAKHYEVVHVKPLSVKEEVEQVDEASKNLRFDPEAALQTTAPVVKNWQKAQTGDPRAKAAWSKHVRRIQKVDPTSMSKKDIEDHMKSNFGEEVEQIDESKTPEYYDNLAKKHTADGQKGTRANMVYASMAARRASRAAEILRNGGSQEDAWKHYQGTTMKKEEVEQMEYIEEKLSKRDPASKWIHDFVASDNPKFAGKSKKMRINMALGAYYAAQRAAPKNEEVVLDEKLDAVGREDADVNNDMKVDVTDKYLLARRAAIRNAIKSKKK